MASGEIGGLHWDRRKLETPSVGFSFEVGRFEIHKIRAGGVAGTAAYDPSLVAAADLARRADWHPIRQADRIRPRRPFTMSSSYPSIYEGAWPPPNLDELLRRAAEILRSEGARHVYVFGSAATGRLHADSDIDLAVAGLPPQVFFSTMAKVGNVFGRSVDLVDLDLDSPFTRYLKEEDELRLVA